MEFFKENKIAIIAGIIFAVAIISMAVFTGGAQGTVDGNATLDQSKSMEVTASSDTISEGSTKLGNIGSVGGNLDLSKKDSHNTVSSEATVTEGNE